MTLNEIKNEVLSLGFEKNIPDDDAFVNALKLGLRTAYSERGVLGRLRFYQRSPIPTLHIPCVYHEGGDKVEKIEAFGRYLCMRLTGKGEVTVSDSDGERHHPFDTEFTYFHTRINGSTTVTFSGEYPYEVLFFSVYSENFPDGYEVPEYGFEREYELCELAKDYLCVASLPEDGSGRTIKGSDVRSGALVIPYSYTGEVRLTYRRRAPEIREDYPDEELGIATELAHLIPLITAAYVWLDDDFDKAQYYMSLYREGMAALKLYSRSSTESAYEDVLRWS